MTKKLKTRLQLHGESGAGFINVILIIIVFLLAIAGTYFAVTQQIPLYPAVNPISNAQNPTPTACTQEAKQCTDGSYVSRTGPHCEFVLCPKPNPIPVPPPAPSPYGKQITLQEGQQEGPLLVQKIYPDYITGLNFYEYPVASNQGQPITLHIGESASNGCTITLTLISIKGDTAIFNKTEDFNRPCPICLAENTLIDTPNGQIPIQNLQKGMTIWTVDASGKRVLATILKTSKTPVPPTHQMVHVILADKREVFASPGHPIGDGRIFNDLVVDDVLDGSKIISTQKVTYGKGYTYDILPSGPTGFYFANRILIDNTLH